jgi:FkbM family methyltransferase
VSAPGGGRPLTRFARRYGRAAASVLGFVVRRPVPIRLHGFSMYVRLDDTAVGLGIAIRRSYEKQVVKAMLPHLKPGSVFVDVGANIGFYTLLAASRVGPVGRVIAFEPSQADCDLIEASVRRNGFTNVVVHRAAAADEVGTIGYRQRASSSNGIVSKRAGTDAQRVSAVTLDSVLRHEPRIDVIKMDVEGAEGLVLAGMTDVLEAHRPVLFSEFSAAGLRHVSHVSGSEFLGLLASRNYDVFGLDDSGAMSVSARQLADELEAAPNWMHHDLMCVPRPAASAGT